MIIILIYLLTQIIKHAKEESKVIVICENSSYVINYLNAYGVDTVNIEFVEDFYNTVWIRDYGAPTIYGNNVDSLYLVDWIYNRSRPLDDQVPKIISEHLDVPLFATTNLPYDLVNTGGNFMSDGQGTGFSSWKPMDLRANYFTFKPNNAEKMTVKSDGVTATTSARITQVAITSSSNAVAWDSTAAANAYHVTTENTTFSAPSNAVEGAVIQVELAQGGTARTIAWNTVFEFAASTAPTVTATANKTDIFTFRYNGSVWQEIGRVQNMAQT